MSGSTFSGFPPETLTFLKNIAQRNDKAWFEAHRDDFNRHLLGPAQIFTAAMGERLRKTFPALNADPRIDRSIFRFHRDTRFSKDKSPYKTHLGILMWEGPGKKMESSGLYFHLEPPKLMLGAGLYMFTRDQLERFRERAIHPRHGASLAKAVKEVTGKGDYVIGGSRYKKVPRGYDPEHKNAELLKHNGLYAWFETKIPPELHSAKIVLYCLKIFRDMAPIHQWMVEFTERGLVKADSGV